MGFCYMLASGTQCWVIFEVFFLFPSDMEVGGGGYKKKTDFSFELDDWIPKFISKAFCFTIQIVT